MERYIGLLRGINVGGNNIIKMTDLKSVFEEMCFEDVKTYIQSGNVIFSAKEKNLGKLEMKIEKTLSTKFNYTSKVVIIPHSHLKKVIEKAPKDFGKFPEEYRYDVLFLKSPLTSKQAIEKITPRDGVDTAHAGEGVLYFSRLISKAGQSYLNKVISLPVYKEMTIRNWNTTSKLLGLCEEGLG